MVSPNGLRDSKTKEDPIGGAAVMGQLSAQKTLVAPQMKIGFLSMEPMLAGIFGSVAVCWSGSCELRDVLGPRL